MSHSYIAQVLAELETWMDEKEYKSISEFKGKLSDHETKATDVYHRAQYLDFLLKPEEIINKLPYALTRGVKLLTESRSIDRLFLF